MKVINCNDCIYIDYTEKQHHYLGIKSVPEHHCNFYKERLLHGNQHIGKDSFINPCERCIFEENKNFVSREFIQFVRECSKYKLSDQQLKLLIEYFKAKNKGEYICVCFPRFYGRSEIMRCISEWEKSKTDGITVRKDIKLHRE